MRRAIPGIAICLSLFVCGGFLATAPAAGPTTRPAEATVRIGTYDARAIAIAYAHSAMQKKELDAKQKEMKEAQDRKDEKRIQELKEWGSSQQRKLHLQGFAAAPVDDILQRVKDRLPAVAAKAHVAVILRDADYVGPGVEKVDVTDDLVKLFDPAPRAMRIIRDMKGKKPLPIEQVATMSDKD